MKMFVRVQLDLGNIGENILLVFNNAYSNRILFADENTYLENELARNQVFQIIKSGFPLILLAKSKGFTFDVKIEVNTMGSFVTVYPVEPVKKKDGIGAEQEELDLGFYIERMIELCEDFPIYELVTGEE